MSQDDDMKKSPSKKMVYGNVSELGTNVYMHGIKNQSELYIKTTEAIAEYVGKKYDKNMKVLVKSMTENIPEEPKEPKTKKNEEVTPFQMKKYEKELSRYYDKLDKYNEYKSKVFIIVMGQCSLSMKNTVESKAEYAELEKKDDVVGLLKIIKDICYSNTEVEYEYWAMNKAMRKVLTMRQNDNEALASYYKRFMNVVEVAESQWGLILPTKIASSETDYNKNKDKIDKETRDKFLACTFISGANNKKYGKCVSDLNNMYLSKQDKYPTTIEGAMTYLSHYMDDKTDKPKSLLPFKGVNFASTWKAHCFCCGSEEHKLNQCPEKDSRAHEDWVVNRPKPQKTESKGTSNALVNEQPLTGTVRNAWQC